MGEWKRLFKKQGAFFLILIPAVIAGSIFWNRWNGDKKRTSEKIAEPAVEIPGNDTGEITLEESIKESEAESEKQGSLYIFPQTDSSLLTEEEKDELKNAALTEAGQAKKVYETVELLDGPSYVSNIKEFTKEQRREAAALLGRAGVVSVTEDTNMENYEKVEEFYAAYMEKRDAEVTVYEVKRDGLIGAVTFIYRDGRLQTYYVGIGWQEGGVPEIRDTLVSDIAEIRLTEKGYFIYTYEGEMAHSNLRQYWRVKPLSDKCRELTEKYVHELSYIDYNLLVTNWDSSNVGDILMPCMFGDIYRIDTGENLKTENGRIPAETYEKIMTTYFPVTKEELREKCGYDESSDSYEYEMMFASPYPPFGEVVDYSVNSANGTITLIVDGVWADYNSDLAFTNTILVQPFNDGTFRYLSNTIEQKELELPPIARVKKEVGQVEKGYDLPVDVGQRKESEDDCIKMMELIRSIYEEADKGKASNVVLSDETLLAMQDKLKETKNPVTTAGPYPRMQNFESADNFLRECMKGVSGSVVVYEIHSEGGIGRKEFRFDGANMYVLNTTAVWGKKSEPGIEDVSYTRIKEWKYTDKGWFCYQLCVPEYPEVTEVVDGSRMIRVKPMTKEMREVSEKCLLGLGYQGNNLLCSDWDTEHMEDLDYNGLYEYLYAMKYQEGVRAEDYPAGIPGEAFAELIMEYLPVTEKDLQKYAVYDGESQTYAWERPDCVGYAHSFFDTSVPEVTDIRENDDGTVTLTADAVCQMMLCDDAVITHELTVRFSEDGSFQYLGNRILNSKIENIRP